MKDETPRKGTIDVKRGTAGPAQKVERPRAAFAQQPLRKEQLDRRQERISSTRRRGPELPKPDLRRPRSAAAAQEVPETDSDESEEEDGELSEETLGSPTS